MGKQLYVRGKDNKKLFKSIKILDSKKPPTPGNIVKKWEQHFREERTA